MYSIGLKRKRSDPSIASSTPSTPDQDWKSTASASPRQPQQWLSRDESSTYLNLRTRKRYRDNRPDEDFVHKTTYQKLFAAQNNLVPCPMDTQSSPSPVSEPVAAAPRATQRSLHNFWTISQPQPSIQDPPTTEPMTRIQCEDCDTVVDEDMMEVVGPSHAACQICSRTVCSTCSIPTDHGRACLQCRTSRSAWT